MKAFGTAAEEGGPGVLTEKQCRVLDLLIENKTSKEIARALGISPYTVDQRISLARGKLGVSSRAELAARYRQMRKMSGRPPSEMFGGPEGEQSGPGGDSDGEAALAVAANNDPARFPETEEDGAPVGTISRTEGNFFPTAGEIDHRVGPEVFEGGSGTLWRIGAIVATSLLLVMTILGLFAIFDQLNDLLA
jgi:DNA-binding CsgD family transcriptional regulator